MTATAAVRAREVERRIFVLRGQKIMMSHDLANLYGVATRILVQAVKRNRDRFPGDFMFQLSEEEAQSLRSQIVILDEGRGRHRKYRPYAFTEQGVAMLSSVLRSPRAIRVNIAIMRAFVRLRDLMASNADLAARIDALERKGEEHDESLRAIYEVIRDLQDRGTRRQVGYPRG